LQKLLEIDPNDRITVEQALIHPFIKLTETSWLFITIFYLYARKRA